jgi:integrase
MTTIEQVTPALTFDQAFEIWIANRTMQAHPGRFTSARYISERTEWDYRQYARALSKMFGKLPMSGIHVGHLREYHRARAFCDGSALAGENWHAKAGANRIRKEIGMLVRMMKSSGCWTEELESFFQPLQREESDVNRALDASEQARFLAVAASRPEYSFVLWYTIAALQTCCSTNELRTLRLGDVNLEHAAITIRVEGAKNKFRRRTIPLESSEVVWAFERLVERAKELGSGSPHHYVFPAMAKRNEYEPTKPMSDSGLKKRWDEVRKAADLKWLRPYDLRHTAITRLAEEGIPIATIMSLAGHVSVKMQQHYTTISMMAKRKAVASTWSKGMPVSARMQDSQSLHPTYQQVLRNRH